MEADDVGHPDHERADVQVDPQNERNTAEEARPAVPVGQVGSMCGCPLGIRIRGGGARECFDERMRRRDTTDQAS